MKILILGEKPSKLGGKSPSIKTLYKWLDILSIKRCSFDNINNYEADHQLFFNLVYSYDKVIALGNVSTAMCFWAWYNSHDGWFTYFNLPHPNPLNRKLNNKLYVQEQLNKCKMYLGI